MSKEDLNREILRVGLIAELDAVNLYEQLVAMTEDEHIRKVFRDIIKEEKTHVGEFQTMLLRGDVEQLAEIERGENEVNELTK